MIYESLKLQRAFKNKLFQSHLSSGIVDVVTYRLQDFEFQKLLVFGALAHQRQVLLHIASLFSLDYRSLPLILLE